MKCEPIEYCPLCGTVSATARPYKPVRQKVGDEEYSMTYVYCPKCGLMYQNPMWYFDYSEEYDVLRNKMEGNSELGSLRHEVLRAMRTVDFIYTAIGKPASILDVGSGCGSLLTLARSRFDCDVMGVEPWNGGREFAKKSDNVDSVATVRDLPDKDWAVIVCSHVLEHQNDPHLFVSQLPRRKSDGMQQALVLEVPNGFSSGSANLWHPLMWTTGTLQRLFNERGWSGPTAAHTHSWPNDRHPHSNLAMIFWR